MNSPLSPETSKGTQIVLSKSILSKNKIGGLRVAEITEVNRKVGDEGKVEFHYSAKLLLPRSAKSCSFCDGSIRINRTTGEAVCKDHKACGHRHGFIDHPKNVVIKGLVRDEFGLVQTPEE